ncbi:hypothetical protein [Paenibacillus gallinarum]|nr:hypothetical protein [Paenibacillus gallinarum]
MSAEEVVEYGLVDKIVAK